MTKRKKELIAFDTLIQSPHLSRMTVANIAKKTGKTKRGVKATLKRRGLKIADYDGRSAEEIHEELFGGNRWNKTDTKLLFIFIIIPILIILSVVFNVFSL